MKKYVLILTLLGILVSSTACNNTNSKNIDVKDNSSDKSVIENNTSKQNVKLEFSTTDIKGKAISNEDVKDSKLIMVNFWEPWCGPCVNEMPELEKLYKKYKDKGFIIIVTKDYCMKITFSLKLVRPLYEGKTYNINKIFPN